MKRTLLFFSLSALISPAMAEQAPDLIITATRTLMEPARAGSDITIINEEEIKRAGTTSFVDILQSVPGLNIHDSGGIGSVTRLGLRGTDPGQTLILIDGIRINDPTVTDGAVDLSNIPLANIQRIEILRGPQSALWGSDAMGGVVNIITKRGKSKPTATAMVEGGSYGTIHSQLSLNGSTERFSYSFTLDALHSDGFPRFGYRAKRPIVIGDGVTPLPDAPSGDPTNRIGFSGRVGYRVTDDILIEAGLMAADNRLQFDNPYATNPNHVYDPYNFAKAQTIQGWAKATIDTFDGLWRHNITLFANSIDRTSRQREGCYYTYPAADCTQGYKGTRIGGEYQGDIKLGRYGLFTFGGRTERETASTSQDPAPLNTFTPLRANQTTNSAFAQHQITLGEALDLSLGGRVDAVESGPTFGTWRATAAYRFTDWGTKLRGSIGTGAKIPSLFQRFSEYGTPSLAPEHNIGWDIGIDQKLLNDRLTLSATWFESRMKDLINFRFFGCPSGQNNGCYYNVSEAKMRGLELAADAVLMPETWRLRGTLTRMEADNTTDPNHVTRLLQRPRFKASASLIWTGIPNLEIEGRVTYVGNRLDYGPLNPVKLSPYTRWDVYGNYKVNDQLSLFVRGENLSNARYEEVYNYGVAGRSIYGGARVTW